MLKFVNCRFWGFSRFKPLMVLLRIIVHQKGNKPNLGQQIAKNGYFYGFLETYFFGEAKIGGFWHNPSCAWITALNRYFFSISLFYRCRFAFMVVFVPNRVDLPFSSQSVCIKPASCLIFLICFASLYPFVPIGKCCLWFANRVSESLVCFQNPMCDLLDLRCACCNHL